MTAEDLSNQTQMPPEAETPLAADEKPLAPPPPATEEDPASFVSVDKNVSFREESNYLSDLKENEKKALGELRSKLESAIADGKLYDDKEGEEEEKKQADVSIWGVPLIPSKGSESTDVVLLKFLRAREFKVEAAFDMLRGTLRWRRDLGIGGDLEVGGELSGELRAACFTDGADREGHPVCFNVYGVFADEAIYGRAFGTEEGRSEFLRWRTREMEKGIGALDFKPGGVSSVLQVNDLKDSPGPAKKELRAAMKQAVQLLQDNYPELVARNIFINVPFWYYAYQAILSPFLTQRTKSKFVFARPAKVAETLLKYIPAEGIPVRYGGLRREDDTEFPPGGDKGSCRAEELVVKAGSTEVIEIAATEAGMTLVWDVAVLGWEVSYNEEFVPSDKGSYTVVVRKASRIGAQEEAMRNSYRAGEPGKVVLTIENSSYKKKKVLYRYKTKSS